MKDFNKEQTNANPSCGGIAFFAMMTLYVFISLIGQSLLYAFDVTEGALFYAVCSTFSIIAIVAAFFLSRIFCKKSISVNFYIKKCDPLYFVFAVILAEGMMFGLGFVNGLIADIMSKFGLNVGGVNPPLNNVGLFILFSVLLAVFPAVAEEIFFRGLILDNVLCGKNRGLRAFKALLSVSLCFALYHGSLTQFFYQLIYGFFLALMTLKSGSVLPAITAHFLNNFAVLFFSFLKINVDLNNPFFIVVGMALLVLFVVFITFYGRGKNKSVSTGDTDENDVAPLKLFWLPYGVLGAAVCAALIIGSAVAI